MFLTVSTSGPALADEGGAVLPSFPWIWATWNGDSLLLRLSGVEPGTYDLYEMDDPPRIVIDIPGITCSEKDSTSEAFDFDDIRLLNQLRASITPDRTRVVLESRYQVHWELTSSEDQHELDILCLLRFRQTLEEVEIDAGTKYIARRYVTPSGQRFTHVVISDPSKSKLRPRVVMASDLGSRGLMSIGEIVNDSRAAAGINGGYFSWPGLSMSFVMEYGEIHAPPQLHRPAFMVLDNGRYIMDYPPVRATIESGSGLRWEADVVNQSPGPGEVALLTPGHPSRLRDGMEGETVAILHNDTVEYVGSETVDDLSDRYILWSRKRYPPIDFLSVGEPVDIDLEVASLGPLKIIHAIQGGPFLVRNGRVSITSAQDDIGRDIANGRAARTAIGFDDSGRVFLIAVEGSNNGRSIGSTLEEMALTLLDLGATWGMNLDGGSSSGMALGFNTPLSELPSGGRRIATAVILIDESGRMQGDEFRF